MNDNKLTDNEIVEAMKRCIAGDCEETGCPLYKELNTLTKQCYKSGIKEFAERLKGEFGGLAVCTVNSVTNKISNLVKEMTEETP